MNGHTPGPWRLHRHHKPISNQWIFQVVTDEEYGEIVAGTCTNPQRPEDVREADAHLIAAAPDLLEMLSGMLEIYGGENDTDGLPKHEVELNLIAHARAAISKARGEQ